MDWENNTDQRLPNFPNGQRVVYPLNAAGKSYSRPIDRIYLSIFTTSHPFAPHTREQLHARGCHLRWFTDFVCARD